MSLVTIPARRGKAGRVSARRHIRVVTGSRLAWGEPVSTPGSYALFRVDMDLIVAFSACPQDILPINGRTGRTTEAHFSVE